MSDTGVKLVAVEGPLKGGSYPVPTTEAIVGRATENWVSVPSVWLSRRHCQIEKRGGRWVVRDLQSRNGTLVNDRPVSEIPLSHGDMLRLGDSAFLFLHDVPPDSADATDAPLGSVVEMPLEETVLFRRDAAAVDPARAAEHLRSLLGLSTAIHSARSVRAVADAVVQAVFEMVRAERACILLYGSSPDDVEFHHGEDRRTGKPVEASRTVVAHVAGSGKALLSNQILGAGGQLASAESLMNARIRSVLAVPLVAFQRSRGLLYADTTNAASAFREDDLQLMTAIGTVAAVAIENARYLEALETEKRRLQYESELEHEMIGDSSSMRAVYERIARVAPTDTTVLIRGESGTGKELAARALHRNSNRSDRAFVAVNCAAIPETLLESEVFGHEKGAFTGAVAQKKGKVELAEGGTLFLDEIGELAPALQSKLLRVLQEREFERVGGTRTIKADIRLLAATNRPLEEQVRSGAFRQDLYYRLNVVTLNLPALRERRDDIPVLAAHFLRKHSQRCGRVVHGLSSATRQLLTHYEWPGNVRELENAVERAVVLGCSDIVLPEDLPELIVHASRAHDVDRGKLQEAVIDTKRQQILTAIEEAGGNITAAARRLGLNANYLHRLIRDLDLRDEVRKRQNR